MAFDFPAYGQARACNALRKQDLLFNAGTGAFLSVGGYHHHIGLNTWFSEGVEPLHRKATGLYHFALNYLTQKDLALAVK